MKIEKKMEVGKEEEERQYRRKEKGEGRKI